MTHFLRENGIDTLFKRDIGKYMKYDEQIDIPVSVEIGLTICREAVSELGWRVFTNGNNHITCKEICPEITSFVWPVQIEVVLTSIENDTCRIYLNGTIFGFGPIQYGHLRGQVGNLHNKILVYYNRYREKYKI